MRYLTIRSKDPDQGTIDIDVVDHGHGRLSSWAATAEYGSTIGFMGPTGRVAVPTDAAVLIAADQSAMPVVARMIETLPARPQGTLIVECDSAEDAAGYFPHTDLTIVALNRSVFAKDILNRTRAICAAMPPSFAFFAGELAQAKQMRAFFCDDLCLGKGAQSSVGYWERSV